jgi:hypothetical protein
MRKTLVTLALTAITLATGAGTATARPAADPLHAGACELSWAFHSGQPVAEDLSFPDATPAYDAVRPELAAQFWASLPAGTDSTEAAEQLEDWLDDQITRPCSDLDSGA